MRMHTLRLLAVSATYFALNSAFAADVPSEPSGGTTSGGATSSNVGISSATVTTAASDAATASAAVPANRIASRFESLAGSPENAASLVAGLRTGTEITLTSPDATTGIRFIPTTRPMGYGNITQALSLAQRTLTAQGITEPTPEQLQIALNGATVTTVDASGATQTVAVPGVLQLRSQGMGWGQIAHQLSLSPGYRPALTATPPAAVSAPGSGYDRSYGRGAIVSGDGTVMQGRVPGYAAAKHGREQPARTTPLPASGKTSVHGRMPVIPAGSSASLGGGYALGISGSPGKIPVQARSHGRF